MDNYIGPVLADENEHDYESYVITIRRKPDARPQVCLSARSSASVQPATPFSHESKDEPLSENMPESLLNGTTASKPIISPLPGVIIEVKVGVGDRVREGQVVAVLEAMKMENEIQAECDGTVVTVNVSQGDSILEGVPIITVV